MATWGNNALQTRSSILKIHGVSSVPGFAESATLSRAICGTSVYEQLTEGMSTRLGSAVLTVIFCSNSVLNIGL